MAVVDLSHPLHGVATKYQSLGLRTSLQFEGPDSTGTMMGTMAHQMQRRTDLDHRAKLRNSQAAAALDVLCDFYKCFSGPYAKNGAWTGQLDLDFNISLETRPDNRLGKLAYTKLQRDLPDLLNHYDPINTPELILFFKMTMDQNYRNKDLKDFIETNHKKFVEMVNPVRPYDHHIQDLTKDTEPN